MVEGTLALGAWPRGGGYISLGSILALGAWLRGGGYISLGSMATWWRVY